MVQHDLRTLHVRLAKRFPAAALRSADHAADRPDLGAGPGIESLRGDGGEHHQRGPELPEAVEDRADAGRVRQRDTEQALRLRQPGDAANLAARQPVPPQLRYERIWLVFRWSARGLWTILAARSTYRCRRKRPPSATKPSDRGSSASTTRSATTAISPWSSW